MSNSGGRGKFNPQFAAEAHRFTKGARNTERTNKNDMGTPRLSESQVPFVNKEEYNRLEPGQSTAPRMRVARMVTSTNDDTLSAGANRTEGLADMATGNKEDQHFDNILWYNKNYAALPRSDGGTHGQDLGKVILDDRFFGYLQKKKEQEFFKQYQMFKLNLVDLSSPPLRDYWQKKFPELVQKKLQFYKNREAIRARFNEIKIRGPNDRADLEFIYLYNLGVFDTSDSGDINDYLNNPADKKIWNAAVNQGIIQWDKIDWNSDLNQPIGTSLDVRAGI